MGRLIWFFKKEEFNEQSLYKIYVHGIIICCLNVQDLQSRTFFFCPYFTYNTSTHRLVKFVNSYTSTYRLVKFVNSFNSWYNTRSSMILPENTEGVIFQLFHLWQKKAGCASAQPATTNYNPMNIYLIRLLVLLLFLKNRSRQDKVFFD